MTCQVHYACTVLHGQKRPCWDCYFLSMAESASERGDCVRKQVGAVLVSPDKRTVQPGYNGSEPGGPSCLEGECERCLSDVPAGTNYGGCVEYHAEWNAIFWSNPAHRKDATLYVTFEPCSDCRKLIKGVGITEVVWLVHRTKIKRASAQGAQW